jgi:hypothetical protein
MPGRGPAPKSSDRRARRNAETIPSTVLRHDPAVAPELPDDHDWPLQTRKWWEVWRFSPQADLMGATDWQFLLDTAKIHAEFWAGNLSVGAELRLRVAKFGATPEDRARLRITFAEADEKDAARPAASTSRERYGDLRAVSE